MKRFGFMRKMAQTAAVGLCLLPAAGMFGQFGPPQKHEPKGPWENKSLSPDERADLAIAQMTLDEKIQFLHGLGWQSMFMAPESGPGVHALNPGGFIPGVPRLGIPDLQMTDAVVGVSGSGSASRYATALPSAVAEASSWDPALAYETGTLVGTEVRAHGFNMALGSGVNLTREPRCGRTFEYKGEDPILAGILVGQELKAEKALGLVTDIKHFAVNDQDDGRMLVNSILDKRSMRESDLLVFQIALRDSGAGAVMCSYNKINGTYACENEYTLTEVLKKDFGFKGFVVSDWGGTHSTVKAALAGLDIEMPGDGFFGAPLKKAVESGEVPVARLNDMVHRILRTEFASGVVDNPPQPQIVDVFRGFEVAQKVEEKGAVLLKNANRQLPLKAASIQSIAVIGGHADVGVMSGGGSSQVSPAGGNPVPPPPDEMAGNPMGAFGQTVYHRSAPLKGIQQKASGASVKFDSGADIASAVALAKASQVAIVFAVQHESEGMDLPSLSLPDKQDALIEAVAATNPHTIVVLETGGAVTMPWIGKVSAVVEAWFPGIRGSEAIANILFGDVNPSGKLPLTFARSEADLPHPKLVSQPPAAPNTPPTAIGDLPPVPATFMNPTPFDVAYDEGLKVGYKWYDAENKEPLFPFGYGLSYTTYAYSDVKAEAGAGLTVSFKVKNTGERAGEEIAQVYLTLPASAQEPPKRLVGWSKVALGPGEQKSVTIQVEPLFLSIYSVDKNGWEIVPGDYKVWVGGSSRDLPLNAAVKLGAS
ncbi:MAG: glycoside hydrolase family 3 C-terminal domain-containing protein [Terracidiphilus sp.]|nr:glycoside hydrolase family 3 C-terminal domain-containing protein [Terracidiphilus sp.]MDR3777423.1 glycoside hydrolase family 3 C-terminal domain-containing protein [Terracidiphilus sp.]